MSKLPADSEQSSDAGLRCRRTSAMASTNVGDPPEADRTKRRCRGHRMLILQGVGGQGGPGEEAQQSRRGAGDGQVGPLALGLHAQMGARFLKGDLELPAQDKLLQDLGPVRRRVGAEEGLGIEGAFGISRQHPADKAGRFSRAVPDGGLGR